MFLECNYEGKILFVSNKLKEHFKYIDEKFLYKKRIFNIIHHTCVVDFIDFYTFFLKSSSLTCKKEFLCILDNKIFKHFEFFFQKNESVIRIYLYSKDKSLNNVDSFIFNFKNLFFLTRTKFIIGSLMPFFFAFFWSVYKYNILSYKLLFLSFVCLVLLHIVANTFNDYFDWKSGRDENNIDYVLSSTGGSRAIDFNIISEKKMLYFSLFLLFIAFIIGSYIVFLKGYIVLIIGAIAFFSVFFYSAPPVHLASRYGLGELMHIICLGPLIIYGTSYVISDVSSILNFVIGLPHGLLITGCLLMNECPDSKFDKLTGKNNLAVFLGAKYVFYCYFVLLLVSFFLILCFLYFKLVPISFMLVFFILPYSFIFAKSIFSTVNSKRQKLISSCIKSLNIYIYYSIISILAIALSIVFNP